MLLRNKKAKFQYELTGEGVEAGLSLLGAEAKSVREGRVDISQSVVRILDGEAYLINANIPAPGLTKYDSIRPRKLLLHRSEILSLITKMKQKRLQIVPLRIYNKGRLIKLYLELGQAKRKFEKKETLKRRDIEREIAQNLKSR
jgi:SsrA-binding protein